MTSSLSSRGLRLVTQISCREPVAMPMPGTVLAVSSSLASNDCTEGLDGIADVCREMRVVLADIARILHCCLLNHPAQKLGIFQALRLIQRGVPKHLQADGCGP